MATGQAAAIARTAILDADMARPQGSLLTVMGRKTIQMITSIGDIEGRIAAGLRAEPSPQADDHQFEPLGDMVKSVIKLGSLASKASDKKVGSNPSPRSVAENEILEKVEIMILSTIQVARQEVVQEVMTHLGTCVGAINVTYDNAASHALARHDEMVARFMASSQAIQDFKNSMSPHNHTRDGKIAELERMWQFSTASFVTQAKLEVDKAKLETEKAFVENKTHVKTLQSDGVTYVDSEFTPSARNAELAALETRATSIRARLKREKTAIYTECTGKDTVPATQSTTIMEWPDPAEDVQCAQLEKNWILFTLGKEDKFDVVFQAIRWLFVDCIPSGDNKHQFDAADLVFDDTNAPEMRKTFIKQDKALYKLLMDGLPDDGPGANLKSRFLGGVAMHHMGKTSNERYKIIPNSACSFIRAILLMDKPLKPAFKKELERDAGSMIHRFKKGSPKVALDEALAILCRNKNHQVAVKVQDWLYNTLMILELRFPNHFGKIKEEHADDSTNSQWNSMPDITDVLSKFISEELQPIAVSIEASQIRMAKQQKIAPKDMWDASSHEARSHALMGGNTSTETSRKATAKPKAVKAVEPADIQSQLNTLMEIAQAQAKAATT